MTKFIQTMRSMHRHGMTALVSLCGMALLTGCAGLGSSDSGILTRDMYDVKTKLDKYLDQQTSSDRQMKFTLDTIDQNMQNRSDASKTALEDMDKRLREQTEEIRSLRVQVETMNFAVDALSKKLGLGMTGGAEQPSNPAGITPFSPTPTPTPNPATTTPGATSVEQMMSNGQRLFNLEKFAEARDEFTRALAQNPSDKNTQVELYYWLAESQYKLNDLDNAEKNYLTAINTNSSHVKSWASVEQLGNIALAKGNKDYALKMFQMIVDIEPQYKYPEIDRVKATIARIKQ